MTDATLPQNLSEETAAPSFEKAAIAAIFARTPEPKPEVTFNLLAAFANESGDTPRMAKFKQAGADILKNLTAARDDLSHICTIQMMPQSKAAPNDVAFRIVGFEQKLISSDGVPASPFYYLVSLSEKGRAEVTRVFCDEAKRKGFGDECLYTATARKLKFGKISWGEADASKIDAAKVANCLIENMKADGVWTSRVNPSRSTIARLNYN